MSTKHLLTISLLLPLVTISATAYAGSTITDKSYWPNEARPSAYRAAGSQSDVNSAFASSRMAPLLAPIRESEDSNVWRYHGGPKSLR
ncbi:hypothetical protein V1281_005909 [Nitrobacteraceae bacterium AZCC 2161]|jgi:hypothetical protein